MPHKFDGEWNYFEMPRGGAAIVPGRKDNMILAIADNGEVDDDNSSQGGFRKIDGNATNTTLDLDATDDVKKTKRKLNGKVMLEKMCNGVLHIVIVGKYEDKDITLIQEEGTWVITKP